MYYIASARYLDQVLDVGGSITSRVPLAPVIEPAHVILAVDQRPMSLIVTLRFKHIITKA